MLQDCEIYWLRSESTEHEFPNLVFVADVDYVTAGMASLTSLKGPEVVAVTMTEGEWNNPDHFAGAVACQERINAQLARDDLRAVPLIRAEEQFSAPAGISFQEFRKLSKPPKLIYRDIYLPDGEAVCIRKEPIAQFIENGGQVVDLRGES